MDYQEGRNKRIWIARVFLKDAPILVVDEATSYVNPINERKIQIAISYTSLLNKTYHVVQEDIGNINFFAKYLLFPVDIYLI